ncbi:SCO family protein [Sphingomonas sp. BIUV-7]|uniref:SCO family protein n=1 Tax=Sphingomonas natans TaxID=3063330 RepID=A0ABT8YCC3_9SPHN|nr:SCO family protein [Sphingomonas sp. BIUV-7]MDO6415989.1 SCO family protein [Sphingomonas sp. BIUV-7]
MNNPRLLAAALLALALGACGRSPPPPQDAPLAGARIGGAFALTDQDGKPFSSEALKGHYAVVYFGYTFCPDVCPTDMLNLGKGLKAFEAQDPARAAKVLPVFITVDPARDTPAVLKAFVGAFHPRMIGLTGTGQQIAAVAKNYATSFKKQDPAPGATGYLMEHMSTAILFGPKGEPIALVPVEADAGQVTQTLSSWVR